MYVEKAFILWNELFFKIFIKKRFIVHTVQDACFSKFRYFWNKIYILYSSVKGSGVLLRGV
jgi:hypothetical protein